MAAPRICHLIKKAVGGRKAKKKLYRTYVKVFDWLLR